VETQDWLEQKPTPNPTVGFQPWKLAVRLSNRQLMQAVLSALPQECSAVGDDHVEEKLDSDDGLRIEQPPQLKSKLSASKCEKLDGWKCNDHGAIEHALCHTDGFSDQCHKRGQMCHKAIASAGRKHLVGS
jgi:hypothetical protein